MTSAECAAEGAASSKCFVHGEIRSKIKWATDATAVPTPIAIANLFSNFVTRFST